MLSVADACSEECQFEPSKAPSQYCGTFCMMTGELDKGRAQACDLVMEEQVLIQLT